MMKMMIMVISNGVNINFMKWSLLMSMMMLITLKTVLIGLMTGTLIETFWLSYIIFLTFLGGMLVPFIYIASIVSNVMFYPKSISMIISLTKRTIITIIFIISVN